MASLRDYVKRYHVANAIKQILVFIERTVPKLVKDIEHYSSCTVVIYTSTELPTEHIQIPYSAQFEATADLVQQRMVNLQKEFDRYRSACTKAERDIDGYEKTIAAYSDQKKYLDTLKTMYHRQLQDIHVFFNDYCYPENDDDSYSPVQASYESNE